MSDVVMPQMGESIVEGTLTKWLKKVGDRVERDEPLFEISTDKVDTEVPSPISGVLEKTFVQEGETVAINTLVARIGEGSSIGKDGEEAATVGPRQPGAAAQAPAGVTEEPRPAARAQPPAAEKPAGTAEASREEVREPSEDGRRIGFSPLVRRLAAEHGIDLREVKGTGQGGRISKKDIEVYLKARQEAAGLAPAAAPSAPGVALPPEPLGAFRPAPQARFGDYTVEPMSAMRKSIAEHMALSKRVSPHVSTVHQVDMTAVVTLRDRSKEKFFDENGMKLTFMPFFLRAAASALKTFRVVNASLDGQQIIYHRDINIGIAVALDWGLIVPVILGVDEKSILGLQHAVTDLAERARKKQLKPDEVQQGTFSITNYGAFGSLLATPAINQPQAAILGLGAVHKAAVVVNDAIAIRSISYLTLSFDHRLVDGALADQFMSHLKAVLESWSDPVL